MTDKVEIFAIKVPDDFGFDILGADIRINDDTATLADFLEAMDKFAEQYVADCRGCDGCCKERAPLIAADIPALAALLPPGDYPVHSVCSAFADIYVSKRGVVDISFARGEGGACNLLNQKEKICSAHSSRAFVCRSHFCLPRSDEISRLREEVVNTGENELTRLLLAEEALGAQPLTCQRLSDMVDSFDYPPNPHSGKNSYSEILLKETLSEELWQQIKKRDS